MPLAAALWGVAALLSIALLAVLVCRSRAAGPAIYAACLVVSLVILGIAVVQLIAGGSAATLRLPIGLPWVGANFRLDALAALFLAVVDLGAAGASLFALGYGRHEQSPGTRAAFLSGFPGRNESRHPGR